MTEAGKETRPLIRLPLSKLEKVLEIVAVIGILAGFILIASVWGDLPEQIPTHFDLSGQPDDWGGKRSLVIVQIVVTALYLLLTYVSRYPHQFNYPWRISGENAAAQYRNARQMLILVKTEMVVFFGYLQWTTIQVAYGKAQNLGGLSILIALATIIGTLSAYIMRGYRLR